MGIVAHKVVLFLIFEEQHTAFHSGFINLYAKQHYSKFPFFPASLSLFFFVFLFYNGHFDRYEVVFNCNFDLHFLVLVISDVEHLFRGLLATYICLSLKKIHIQFLCSYFNQTIWTLSCTIALYLLDINPLIRCIIWKLLPFSRLPFNLLMVSFIIQKIFSLMKSYLFLLLLSLPMESDAKIISKSSVKELTTYVFS